MKGDLNMSDERKAEIENVLTNNPETVNYLCSLSEDRYPIVFKAMKLVKLLELQKVSNHDIKLADDVRDIYTINGVQKLALMAFIYGKIQGKTEERARKREQIKSKQKR
jgi:hypothetical protein